MKEPNTASLFKKVTVCLVTSFTLLSTDDVLHMKNKMFVLCLVGAFSFSIMENPGFWNMFACSVLSILASFLTSYFITDFCQFVDGWDYLFAA